MDYTRGLIIGNTAKAEHLVNYEKEVLKGIAADFMIQRFSESHQSYQNSIRRIDPRFSANAPFLVNIFYDHLLAKNWDAYSNINLADFSEKVYSTVLNYRNSFPYKIRKFAPKLIDKRWITSLVTIEGTHHYLVSLSKHERLYNTLDQGLLELTENYLEYQTDFMQYFFDLRKFMEKETDELKSKTSNDHFVLVTT